MPKPDYRIKQDKPRKPPCEPLITLFLEWLGEECLLSLPASDSRDAPTSLRRYTLYKSLCLLSADLLSNSYLSLESDITTAAQRLRFYAKIAARLKVTHIAANAWIPSQTQSSEANILRSPVGLVPLYGSFEPEVASNLESELGFDEVFWTSTVQNGITQTWAPTRTMFSRGNVREKARLLELLDQDRGIINPQDSSAVDLYGGIGYFTFCYAKAGFKLVLAWELNPWSVEGLRRGCLENRFRFRRGKDVFIEQSSQPPEEGIVAFQEDNASASERIKSMRASIPPVRHVNCGLLPTSEGSYETALVVLDLEMGGWIHIHENVDVKRSADILNDETDESRSIRLKGEGIIRGLRATEADLYAREVMLLQTFKVKSFAARVLHVVFDIHVGPRIESST